MNKLICITGLTGSGKSIASDYLVKKGFAYLRFGQITIDEVRKRNLPLNEDNERVVREDLRKKYGMAAYAVLNLPKINALLTESSVVGDGMYSFEEYKTLKNEFGEKFITIAIFAPPKLRYERLEKRSLSTHDKMARFRPTSLRDSESRDYAEIENLNKGGTIAMADYTILNTKDLKSFYKQLDEVYEKIQEE